MAAMDFKNQHKSGYNSVSFTYIHLRFSMVVTKNDPQL